MELTFYFLRHGETTASREGGYCGDLDPDLTAEGRQMASDFANAYGAVPWAGVFTSPLKRSVDTVRPFCQAIGAGMQVRDGLRESAFGRWEGMLPEQVQDRFHDSYVAWLADPGWNAPDGGERGVDVARRSTMVLDEIERTHPSGNILVASHKATIRIMLCSLLGIDVGRYRDRIDMPVASVSVVAMTGRGPLLQRLGDRAHLRLALRDRPGT